MNATKPVQSFSCWSDGEAAFYLNGLDVSGYAETLTQSLRPVGKSLLEIGAGDGRLGEILCPPDGVWTALEPNRWLFAKLRSRQSGWGGRATGIRDFWQNLPRYPLASHDTVLCANIPGTTGEARRLWSLLRPLAQSRMLWIVSAQEGPATFCLANLLPPEIHGRRAGPAYADTLVELRETAPNPDLAFVDWEFRHVFSDMDAAVEHFEDRLQRFGHPPIPQGREALREVLQHRLRSLDEGGFLAVSPKRSAILQWRFPH